MITITQGPATFQRPIVRWIEDTFNEDGTINVPAHQEWPTNPNGTPQMEDCEFTGILLQDGANTYVLETLKAVVNGTEIDVYNNSSKLRSYPNTAENLAAFEAYLSDGEQPVATTRAERMKRIAIGKEVIEQYLDDNEAIQLTTQQSLAQLQKFSAIKALLEVGTITKAKELLQATPVDEVFTQARKNKYLASL